MPPHHCPYYYYPCRCSLREHDRLKESAVAAVALLTASESLGVSTLHYCTLKEHDRHRQLVRNIRRSRTAFLPIRQATTPLCLSKNMMGVAGLFATSLLSSGSPLKDSVFQFPPHLFSSHHAAVTIFKELITARNPCLVDSFPIPVCCK
jgi:hypothetical protein